MAETTLDSPVDHLQVGWPAGVRPPRDMALSCISGCCIPEDWMLPVS